MIVVDSSAIVAILFDEPGADRLTLRLAQEPQGRRLMSTASYLEAGTVLAGRIAGDALDAVTDLDEFLAQAGIDLAPVDETQARVALRARIRYGRGFGTGGKLNYGDAFSYALAKRLDAPLLFIGNDFRNTDLVSAVDANP